MNAARPVNDWLADAAAPPLKARLALSQRIRDFAARELQLPDNPSYRRYADLQRRAVVWNVVAAPPNTRSRSRPGASR
jgi:predicted aminopeptidase